MSEQRAPSSVPAFELRHRLARALEEADVSNEEMAHEIGRGVTTIRNYLRGRTIPERAVLVTWALRCGVPFDWLSTGVEPQDGDDPGGLEVSRRGCNGAQVLDFRARAVRAPASAVVAA